MIKRSLIAVAAGCLLAGCGQSMSELGGKTSPTLSDQDNTFFKQVAIGDKTEISSSELALQKSNNADVKMFAQHMIDDHKMADTQAMTLANSKDVTLPQQLDDKHQSMVDGLKNKSGTDFDKAYISLQVAAHDETVTNVENEANNGQDASVKAMAQHLLPTMREHLKMAQDMQAKMANM